VGTAVFVAELTDKDALLLLSLATRFRPRMVFAAGSLAFTITTTIIVTLGHFLSYYVPVSPITLVGGAIMIAYGIWNYKTNRDDGRSVDLERRLSTKTAKGLIYVFLSAVGLLAVLDLAGDATEILIILFVARFQNTLLVFVGALVALIAATAVETMIGNRLSKLLSIRRIRIISLCVFLIIGSAAILTTLFHL
jgi:putative Ca2+/H+ antiporter (TMEM165/GDT1 family)